MLAPVPPLDPSGPEGRRLLRAELLGNDYRRDGLAQRVLAWLERIFARGVGSASGVSWERALATMLIVVLLGLALTVVLSRLRRERRRRTTPAAVLPDERVSAADLRRRAEGALAQGRYDEAVVDAFRAVTVRAIEQGMLEDQPGATAHEVAIRLAAARPDQERPVATSADLFDATLYGDRVATREDASEVLVLDDRLATSR